MILYVSLCTFQVSSMSNPAQPPPSMLRSLLTGAAPPSRNNVAPLVPLGTPHVSNFSYDISFKLLFFACFLLFPLHFSGFFTCLNTSQLCPGGSQHSPLTSSCYYNKCCGRSSHNRGRSSRPCSPSSREITVANSHSCSPSIRENPLANSHSCSPSSCETLFDNSCC